MAEEPRRQAVRTMAGNVPVYGYGYTYILAESPDLIPEARLQAGNDAPTVKIRPKRSSEIRYNLLGATPPRMPRTPQSDYQPLLPIRLIDGNPRTCWCSRAQVKPDVEPVWIRIDLARESTVCAVALVQRAPAERGDPKQEERIMDDMSNPSNIVGRAMPRRLEIRLSRDAWHWETVYESHSGDLDEPGDRLEVKFSPRRAKQIWVIGQEFPLVENFGHCFSIAALEVLDESGSNLALITKGAGVTVSGTHYGLGDERESHEDLWPLHWDLGLKWVRVGYHDDPINWHWVEREKGKYYIDPLADRAITECIENGVNVVMSLGFGNWLYTKEGSRPWADFYWEQYYDLPPPPIDKVSRKAFLKFVKFLVSHFADRVKCWELWNEWNIPPYWGGRHMESDVEEYIKLAKALIPVVKDACPDAKLVLGSTGGWYGSGGKVRDWVVRTLEELGTAVDIIGFHPLYHVDPDSDTFRRYADTFRELKGVARRCGFEGDFWVTEYTWSAPYPSVARYAWCTPSPAGWCTEIIKAKCMAVATVTHTALEIGSFWNETWQSHMARWDVGLLRNTFSADPHNPRQPQPAYYVMRTLATALDSLRPAEIPVKVRGTRREYQVYSLARDGEKVLAIWLTGRPGDGDPAEKADITFVEDDFSRAVGVDVINGTEQELRVSRRDGRPVLKGLLLKDWPVLVRLKV